jgi:hypothetical protein
MLVHCSALIIAIFLTLVFFEPGTSMVLPSGLFDRSFYDFHLQNQQAAPRNAMPSAFVFPKRTSAPAKTGTMVLFAT